ncbi:MAG: hypothetical protein KJ955_03360 [Nanoarchaeota archaeon]|nr:hypothetical protein [Nanoarchaeota archaeon]
MNQKKSMAFGIATGVLLTVAPGIIMPYSCSLALAGTRVTSDSSTLTIEASEDYGEAGRRTVVWQQFDDGETCAMRYIEVQDCPNARRNDGVQYSCNGDSYRDIDCDGAVDEYGINRIGRITRIVPRSNPEFNPALFDLEYRNLQEAIEGALEINLEAKVREWREQREVN